MRRMYSVQELSEIVSAVVGQKIEDGSFDSVMAGAVDDYLTEHPVDITALEGQTIAPAVVNATTSISAPVINGETSPSVKPIYCHPIEIKGDTDYVKYGMTLLIFNNSSTPFTLATFKQWLDDLYTQVGSVIRIMASGGTLRKADNAVCINDFIYKAGGSYGLYGRKVTDASGMDLEYADWESLFDENTQFTDGVNKIN